MSDLQCNRTKSNETTTSNFLHTRYVLSNLRVAVAENDTDHVTCKMEPLLQLVKMD